MSSSGDYQKLYKDLDIGSSDDDRDADSDEAYGQKKKTKSSTPAKSDRVSAKKKSLKECPGCGTKLSVAMKQCNSCDYQFTSKSMLMLNSMNQQSVAEESQAIRDRFPFEPERVSCLPLHRSWSCTYPRSQCFNVLGRRRKFVNISHTRTPTSSHEPALESAFQACWYGYYSLSIAATTDCSVSVFMCPPTPFSCCIHVITIFRC